MSQDGDVINIDDTNMASSQTDDQQELLRCDLDLLTLQKDIDRIKAKKETLEKKTGKIPTVPKDVPAKTKAPSQFSFGNPHGFGNFFTTPGPTSQPFRTTTDT
ncbi:unnamed protein product, partial [Allacma fusca]